MARLPIKVCHMVHSLFSGAEPQPDVRKLNEHLRQSVGSRLAWLKDPDGLLSGFWEYIESDRKRQELIDCPDPVPGIRLLWRQYLNQENQGKLSGKFYMRLGPLQEELGLSRISNHDVNTVAEAIRDRFVFCVNQTSTHLDEDFDVIRLVLYGEDSKLDDPILRNEDLKRIGRHVVETLGAVNRSTLAYALVALMPPGLHFPSRAAQVDLDEPVSEEDGSGLTRQDTIGKRDQSLIDVEELEAWKTRIWSTMTLAERYVWAGRENNLSARGIIAWCAASGVPDGPRNAQRVSDAFGRVKKKLAKLKVECDDEELFKAALAAVYAGPMELLLESNTPQPG
ncbi:MAG: hypothetical protein KF886_23505 [Candidatus Hydrogenedentes bacterium]|nr:hypothetical protein [Candidatus Hydrogenedentota bacterium]